MTDEATELRISFERSGGFAGMTKRRELDTRSLPPDEAARLREAVEQARFFDQPADLTAAGPGADRFQYVVQVEGGGRRHTVRLAGGAAPEEMQPLLDHLTRLARGPAAD